MPSALTTSSASGLDESPAHDPARRKVDNGCQVVPAALSPDVRNITAPDLIGGGDGKLTIQHVRDIRSLHGGLFVGMGARLLADLVHLAHPLAYLSDAQMTAELHVTHYAIPIPFQHGDPLRAVAGALE